MQIEERIVADLTILDLSGKLTSGEGAQRLHDKIESLIFQKRTHVIVNLAGVPYIDSSGLGQLVCAHGSFANAGGRLTLINLNARNNDLLAITKLVAVFETFETEETAVESYPATARAVETA
jgi:anti-sigma B factor antagonist